MNAVHSMEAPLHPHVVVELAPTIRQTDFGRSVGLAAEDSSSKPGWYDPAAGVFDATCDDDCHHAPHVPMTKESFGYCKNIAHDPGDPEPEPPPGYHPLYRLGRAKAPRLHLGRLA